MDNIYKSLSDNRDFFCPPTKLKYCLGPAGKSTLDPSILILRGAGAAPLGTIPILLGFVGWILGIFPEKTEKINPGMLRHPSLAQFLFLGAAVA